MNKTFSFVAEVSGETDKLIYAGYGGEMPIITLRDNIFFPGTVSPITVGRKYSIKTLRRLERTDGMVALLTQKSPDVDSPGTDDLYPIGVAAKLVHSMKMPDGTYNALFQAFNRIEIQELRQANGSYEGTVVNRTDIMPSRMEQPEYRAMLAMLKERTERLMNILDDYPDELTQYISNMEPSTFMLNTICSYLPLTIEQKYELLSSPTELQRLQQAIQFANNITELMQLKRKIENKTRSDLDQQQREYFLRQQVQNIQSELGDKDESTVKQEDVAGLKAKAATKHWSKETGEIFDKELSKLNRINIQSPDYNVQLQYLQTVVGLVWNIINSILIFLIVVLAIRLIILMVNKSSYTSNPLLNAIDSSLGSLAARVSKTFSGGKQISYKAQLITTIIVFVVITIIGSLAVGAVCNLIGLIRI